MARRVFPPRAVPDGLVPGALEIGWVGQAAQEAQVAAAPEDSRARREAEDSNLVWERQASRARQEVAQPERDALCRRPAPLQRVLPTLLQGKSDGAAAQAVLRQPQAPAAGPQEPLGALEASRQPEEARREQP